MRTPTAVTCEVVGGPRDGDLIVVPGDTPPEHLRVILPPDHSCLYVWHPAAAGIPDMNDAEMFVLDLDYRPAQGHPTWRYLWPTNR
jgi:hypothetical protein